MAKAGNERSNLGAVCRSDERVTLAQRLLFRLAAQPLIGPPVARAIAWRAARALAQPAAHLKQALPFLPRASKDLEKKYLELGSALESLAQMARDLVKDTRYVVAMASGKETGEADFERTLGVLTLPAEYLSQALADLPEIAGSLRRAASEAGRLVALEQALERTLAPLRFTQLMFSVESASLSADARESFGALTNQIGALHQRVQSSLREHFESLMATRNSLTQAVGELERFSAERAGQLERRRGQVAETLALLSKEVSENARRDVQLTSTSEALSAEVNRAVTAMQTQDIVAQKLDHAQRGLSDAVQALEEVRVNARADRLRQFATVARIELAQLDAVSDELAHSQSTLGEAVSGIEGRLAQMDTECLMLHEFRNITASVDGTAQVLIDSLGALREMTADTLGVTRRLEEILRPVESAADIVTGSVSAVAAEIHRIALNAQIHAVETGAQTGLEVLAEHIAGLAGDTLQINAQLCTGLASSVGEMTASIARLARLREQGEKALRTCNQDGDREEASLHVFRDRVLAAMLEVGALLDRGRRQSTGMFSALDLSTAVTLISDVRQRVKQLADCATSMAPPPDQVNTPEQAAQVARRYTMASERQTHHKALRALQPSTASRSTEPAPDSQFGAGVEMF
jgi:hypothetical protein